ncbi:MAG: M1 family peptidase [Desulfobacteraceae bacterium]|nr:MAG: M1 family peptidase [Desulfobacteraceae bacterium]
MGDSILCRLIQSAAVLALAFSIVLFPGSFHAAPVPVEHSLEISLFLQEQKLVGRDVIRVRTDDRSELSFHLSDRAQITSLSVNGKKRFARFSDSEIIVQIEPSEKGEAMEIEILYEAVFNDPLPDDPVNTDNPGFGVTATISRKGVFLLPGAGWYPELRESRSTYRLTVKAPLNILAVTAGRSLGHRETDGMTISEWRIDHPVEGLALSAAPYEVHEQTAGEVIISLYLFPESRPLAPAYLEATADYVRFYSDLFGPYPFPKFSVVENFFPTGYGFPSYTLLGSSVLRLPFLIRTSLGHEIAHSWWGNGVYIDYGSGNWGEGLTTYVADYLYEEKKSEEGAREYRLQAIRNYTTLVPSGADYPLSKFTERVDPPSKAIGYDKGAMIFHMLRRSVGEEIFWSALRELYRSRLFRKTSWKDIQRIFEAQSRMSLGDFFGQWVYRKGAPRIRLENVREARKNGSWKIEADLLQDAPEFHIQVDAFLQCEGSGKTQKVDLAGVSAKLELECSSAPVRLSMDPEFHLLRRLDESEIPPAVNLLKSSPSTLLILPEDAASSSRSVAGTLAVALGLGEYRIVSEGELEQAMFSSRDIVLIGLPMEKALLPRMPPGTLLEKDRFILNERLYNDPADAFFGVFGHPGRYNGVLAVFLPLSMKDAGVVARKVAHYGRYSYVTFRDGVNREKGNWATQSSPVVHEFINKKGAP